MQIAPLMCICNNNPMVGTINYFCTSWEFDFGHISIEVYIVFNLDIFTNYFVLNINHKYNNKSPPKT
jgi:hypothetical protein